MSRKLDITLTQQQTVTQQMVQTASILQMNTQELKEYLNELLLENPVIEPEETPAEETFSAEDPAEEDLLLKEQETRQRLQDWLSGDDLQNAVYYRDDRTGEDMRIERLQSGNPFEDLHAYLRLQLLRMPYSEEERRIVSYLIDSVDENGYQTETAGSAAEKYAVPEKLVKKLIQDIKGLEPAGVGAENLEECLRLQLLRRPGKDPLAEQLLEEKHLKLLARNHFQEIAEKLRVTPAEIGRAYEVIRSLEPKPGSVFAGKDKTVYIRPDVLVIRSGGRLEIITPEPKELRFCISRYYLDLAKTTEDRETAEYLREKIAQARAVERDMRNRLSTIGRVAEVLAVRQKMFFVAPDGRKAPLKLSDIAGELGLHESTVSRAMKGKYLQCERGVYPMSYFLTGVAAVGKAGERQTAEESFRKIGQVIVSENREKPFSDEKIRLKLEEEGVYIARRTVNKYRQQLGIPDKIGRKKWT